MAEPQLTGLQRRAKKYLNRVIVFNKMPGETVSGHFIGFDESSPEKAILQLSNAADRIAIPLMYLVNYCEEIDDAKNESGETPGHRERPAFDPEA